MSDPIVIHRHRSWAADLGIVWTLVSNTDAFNRVAGFGMRFSRTETGWVGRQPVGPFTITWTEDTLDLQAPTLFRSTRNYDNGPIVSAVTEVRLEETPEGTRLDYTVELTPRHVAVLVRSIGVALIGQRIDKGLAAIEAALLGADIVFDPPPPLSQPTLNQLETALDTMAPSFQHALSSRLQFAPLVVQHRLRPLEIAAADGLDPDGFTSACLDAVDAGILELSWELLCPRCLGPGAHVDELDLSRREAHCDSCGIRYDAAIADNVEAVFHPHPSIRLEPPVADCVLTPSATPHLLARFDVRPNGTAEWETPLDVGCYRLDCGDRTTLVEVDTRHTDESTVVLHLREQDLAPSVLRVAPGTIQFILTNRRDTFASVRLSRRWRPHRALTAARLLSRPALRERTKTLAIADTIDTVVTTGSVLMVETNQSVWRELDAIVDFPWRSLSGVDRFLTFEHTSEAMAVAEQLIGTGWPMGIGLAHGLLVDLVQGDVYERCGEAVEEATDAVRRVGMPQIAIAERSLGAFADTASDAIRIQPRPGHPALVAFASVVDGTDLPAPARRTAPVDTRLPDTIAGYPVLKELDRGGMGQVLEVVDPDTSERLAVKRLLPHVRETFALQMFLREAHYASTIEHPNIVRMLDWGDDLGHPYIVMERLIGCALPTHVERVGALPLRDVRAITIAVLDALTAIHATGLVHRDIKPGNLFVLGDRSLAPAGIKLLDFGLMRHAGRERHESFQGTPAFSSPEQVLLGSVDARSDLFSVALVAYWMATKSVLYSGSSEGRRALDRLDDRTDSVREHVALGGIAPVLARALHPEPAHRYETAAEMRDDLLNVRNEPLG